jgi:hypothetical protein
MTGRNTSGARRLSPLRRDLDACERWRLIQRGLIREGLGGPVLTPLGYMRLARGRSATGAKEAAELADRASISSGDCAAPLTRCRSSRSREPCNHPHIIGASSAVNQLCESTGTLQLTARKSTTSPNDGYLRKPDGWCRRQAIDCREVATWVERPLT